jgi:DHA1 family tetracycline resistance protein-like MFS transporter
VIQTRPVSLAPILAINFIGTLGFSLVLPFLVFLVTDWGGNALVYGLTGATYSVFQLIGAPLLGRWSDRVGRRRVLLVSQTGTLLSWLIFLGAFALPRIELLEVDSAFTGQFVLTLPLVILVVARALDGVTGGNISVANAYVADITTEDARTQAFGRMAVSSNLGFVLGPALAGVLGATTLGPVAPVGAAAAISLAATLAILFRLPESNPCALSESLERGSVRKLFGQEPRDCFERQGAPSTLDVLRAGHTGLARVLAMHFLVMLSFNFFYVTFPIFAVGRLEWSLPATGTFFAVMGLLMVAVQGPLLGWITRHVRESSLVVGGSLLLAASFWLFNSPSTPRIYAAVVLMALGNGVMWPSVLALLSRVAGERDQGAVQGLSGSLGAVASVTGLVLGGLLYASIGPRVFQVSAAVTLAVALVGLTTTRLAPGEQTRKVAGPR